VFLWDNAVARVVVTNVVPAAGNEAANMLLGSEARVLLFKRWTYPEWHAIQPDFDAEVITNATPLGGIIDASLTRDCRFVVFSGYAEGGPVPPGIDSIYVYDFSDKTARLISRSFGSTNAANRTCDSAVISADGRFVVYCSSATDLLGWDADGARRIYLYDRWEDTTIAVAGLAAPSVRPAFSPHGKRLIFQSWDSSLIDGDFNQNGDLFTYELPTSESEPIKLHIRLLPSGVFELSWTITQGFSYRVQTIAAITQAAWIDSSRSASVSNLQATWTDPEPIGSSRYYRVIAEQQNVP
jgi:hypothetical protein